ncbi:hypothetical protein [Thermoactinomyces mirandus]|uniref:Uncharacterized protein n=1 Tax=Thermoactinomyces mirandus TaxID=2756294 RepID=A0A7W1XQK6_9BACL|nr:hypothetical protein [Thermoactinomyces mirandus]MBA4601335.1 hypothetical protein [Thermoactinomyces mirandus]
MKIKHMGIFFIVMAVIYTSVELLVEAGESFNFFVPLALLVGGIHALVRKDRDEKIFKKNKA